MSEAPKETRLSWHTQPKRIRVACNACRKKKTRCDGAARCMNCAIAQEPAECVYDEKVAKPERKRSRKPKLDEIWNVLNSRVDRLEAMMQSVAGAIPDVASKIKDNNGVKKEMVEVPRSILANEEEHADASGSEYANDGSNTASPSSAPSELINASGKVNEIYLGNHSFFSILSKSSLAWMKNHLSEENANLLVPLTNLPYVFNNRTKRFADIWLKGHSEARRMDLLRSPLPKRKEGILDLVSNYPNSFNAVQILCLIAEVNTYIKRYYSTSHTNKRGLLYAQLFKLLLAVLICLSDAMEACFNRTSGGSSPENTASVGGLTLREMSLLRDQLIEVGMGYYYELSISGLGLETVKALLFFAVFLVKCSEPPDITHMVLNQAIRKSLDTGLHRIETYRNCTREMYEVRVLVWRTACYFDMEMCFRSGKPPIVNYSDISEELRTSAPIQGITNDAYPLSFLKNYDWNFQIRLETYNRLFSATADTKTFNALQRNVDYLNDQMFSLLARMTPDHRPYFYNQPGFKEITEISCLDEEHRVTLILTFFVNMMTINRLPMMFAFPGVRPDVLLVYKNLSLNSARSIMHLLKNFHAYGRGKAPSLWITYFPVISVLHLLTACMSDPKSPEAHGDILLIIEMCETWFNRKLSPDGFRTFRFDMSVLIQVLMKCVTNIAVSIFEMNTGIEIIAKNEKMKGFFDGPRKFFPELFGSAETLQKVIPLIFESKSPFPSDGTPASCASPCSLSNLVDSYGAETHCSDTSSISEGQPMQNVSSGFESIDPSFGLNGLENFLFDQLDEFPNFFFDGVNGVY